MDFKEFYTGANDNNRRLDKVLRIFIKTQPLSAIYKYLRKGLIKVNDKKSTPEYKITAGDKISIAAFILQNSVEDHAPEENSVVQLPEIVFENQHIIIFNKPVDLAVHGENSLEKNYLNFYNANNNSEHSLSFKPGPLHRIDRMTSGLIAFSKSIDGAHWFSEAIKTHVIQKKYFTVLSGKLENEQEWTDYIKSPDDNLKSFHKVEISSKRLSDEYKIAETIVKPVVWGNYKNQTLTVAEIQIKTGRQHQIRAQSSYHKFPLFGDTAYNGQKNPVFNNFFLHAFCLMVPADNPLELPAEIKAPLPKEFLNFINQTCDCDIDIFKL